MKGEINVPTTLIAQQAGEWQQVEGPKVNLRTGLDQLTMSFTPSVNGNYKFQRGNEVFEVNVGTVVPEPTPTPTPQPVGTIYDSNINGKWNNNHERKVTDYDPDCPKPFVNGGGLEMHASGNPRCYIDGKGGCILEADAGHGRYYGDAINYEGVSEYSITFLDDVIDNHTHQVRSRHQEGGANENKFGGLNFKLSRSDCGVKVELYHGSGSNHINGPEPKLPKPIAVGQKVGVRCTYRNNDSKSVAMKQEVDFGQGFVETVKWIVQLPDYAMNKALYLQSSYFWMRINNTKTGKIKIENHTIKP